MVYRITITNTDGKVSELAWKPMLEFCAKYGLESVVELFYGRAVDFVMAYHPDSSIDYSTTNGVVEATSKENKEFGQYFIEALEHKYLEKPCKYNRNEVPCEGVVIRIDHLEEAESYKLKSFQFLNHESKELDKGEVDLETQESSEEVADEA